MDLNHSVKQSYALPAASQNKYEKDTAGKSANDGGDGDGNVVKGSLNFFKSYFCLFFIYISLIFAKVGGVDMVDFLSLEFEYVGRMQYVGRKGSFM